MPSPATPPSLTAQAAEINSLEWAGPLVESEGAAPDLVERPAQRAICLVEGAHLPEQRCGLNGIGPAARIELERDVCDVLAESVDAAKLVNENGACGLSMNSIGMPLCDALTALNTSRPRHAAGTARPRELSRRGRRCSCCVKSPSSSRRMRRSSPPSQTSPSTLSPSSPMPPTPRFTTS